MAPGPCNRLLRVGLVSACLLLAVVSASARSVIQEPAPWRILDDDPTFTFDVGMSDDDRSGWSSSRAGLMFRLSMSGDSKAYGRWAHLSYDDVGLDASTRWPGIVVTEPTGEDDTLLPTDEAVAWDALDRHVGWNRPEFGLVGRTRLPLTGGVAYALSAWLPFASNELYPYAARSISARVALRKEIVVSTAIHVVLDGVLIRDMAPGGDLLSEDAMGGWNGYGAGLRLWPGGSWRIEGGWSALESDGASLARIRIEASRAFGEDLRCALRIDHHPGDDGDRPYATRVLAVWSLALPGGEEFEDDLPETP